MVDDCRRFLLGESLGFFLGQSDELEEHRILRVGKSMSEDLLTVIDVTELRSVPMDDHCLLTVIP